MQTVTTRTQHRFAMNSFEITNTYNADDESRDDELDLRCKRRDMTELEKLDLKSKELEVKSKELEVKLKEHDTKKRIRDIEYELLDKAVDRYSTLCPDNIMDKELEDVLKNKYRRMIKDT